jgi:hypothetical protein
MYNCTLITDHCLSCGVGGELWKGHANPKFPQTVANYNHHQTELIGGMFNSRNTGTMGSSFTILKKSLTTVHINNLPSNLNPGTPTSYTNTGGPGDKVSSVPIITSMASSGIKSRLNVAAHQTGVDVKHGSYERYLARKRGFNMRCQGC